MLNRYRRHWSYNLSRNINLRFCTQWALEAHLSGYLSFTSCFQWPSERLNSSSADEAVLQSRTRRDDQPLLVSILRRRCLRRSVSVQWTAEATAKEEALAAACYRWPFLWTRPRRSTDAETNCSRLKCTGKISMQNLRFYSFRLMNTTWHHVISTNCASQFRLFPTLLLSVPLMLVVIWSYPGQGYNWAAVHFV